MALLRIADYFAKYEERGYIAAHVHRADDDRGFLVTFTNPDLEARNAVPFLGGNRTRIYSSRSELKQAFSQDQGFPQYDRAIRFSSTSFEGRCILRRWKRENPEASLQVFETSLLDEESDIPPGLEEKPATVGKACQALKAFYDLRALVPQTDPEIVEVTAQQLDGMHTSIKLLTVQDCLRMPPGPLDRVLHTSRDILDFLKKFYPAHYDKENQVDIIPRVRIHVPRSNMIFQRSLSDRENRKRLMQHRLKQWGFSWDQEEEISDLEEDREKRLMEPRLSRRKPMARGEKNRFRRELRGNLSLADMRKGETKTGDTVAVILHYTLDEKLMPELLPYHQYLLISDNAEEPIDLGDHQEWQGLVPFINSKKKKGQWIGGNSYIFRLKTNSDDYLYLKLCRNIAKRRYIEAKEGMVESRDFGPDSDDDDSSVISIEHGNLPNPGVSGGGVQLKTFPPVHNLEYLLCFMEGNPIKNKVKGQIHMTIRTDTMTERLLDFPILKHQIRFVNVGEIFREWDRNFFWPQPCAFVVKVHTLTGFIPGTYIYDINSSEVKDSNQLAREKRLAAGGTPKHEEKTTRSLLERAKPDRLHMTKMPRGYYQILSGSLLRVYVMKNKDRGSTRWYCAPIRMKDHRCNWLKGDEALQFNDASTLFKAAQEEFKDETAAWAQTKLSIYCPHGRYLVEYYSRGEGTPRAFLMPASHDVVRDIALTDRAPLEPYISPRWTDSLRLSQIPYYQKSLNQYRAMVKDGKSFRWAPKETTCQSYRPEAFLNREQIERALPKKGSVLIHISPTCDVITNDVDGSVKSWVGDRADDNPKEADVEDDTEDTENVAEKDEGENESGSGSKDNLDSENGNRESREQDQGTNDGEEVDEPAKTHGETTVKFYRVRSRARNEEWTFQLRDVQAGDPPPDTDLGWVSGQEFATHLTTVTDVESQQSGVTRFVRGSDVLSEESQEQKHLSWVTTLHKAIWLKYVVMNIDIHAGRWKLFFRPEKPQHRLQPQAVIHRSGISFVNWLSAKDDKDESRWEGVGHFDISSDVVMSGFRLSQTYSPGGMSNPAASNDIHQPISGQESPNNDEGKGTGNPSSASTSVRRTAEPGVNVCPRSGPDEDKRKAVRDEAFRVCPLEARNVIRWKDVVWGEDDDDTRLKGIKSHIVQGDNGPIYPSISGNLFLAEKTIPPPLTLDIDLLASEVSRLSERPFVASEELVTAFINRQKTKNHLYPPAQAIDVNFEKEIPYFHMPWRVLHFLSCIENREGKPLFFAARRLRECLRFPHLPIPSKPKPGESWCVRFVPSEWDDTTVDIHVDILMIANRQRHVWSGEEILRYYDSATRMIRRDFPDKLREDVAFLLRMYAPNEAPSKLSSYKGIVAAIKDQKPIPIGDLEVYRCASLGRDQCGGKTVKDHLADSDLSWVYQQCLDVVEEDGKFFCYSPRGKRVSIDFTATFPANTRHQIKALDKYLRGQGRIADTPMESSIGDNSRKRKASGSADTLSKKNKSISLNPHHVQANEIDADDHRHVRDTATQIYSSTRDMATQSSPAHEHSSVPPVPPINYAEDVIQLTRSYEEAKVAFAHDKNLLTEQRNSALHDKEMAMWSKAYTERTLVQAQQALEREKRDRCDDKKIRESLEVRLTLEQDKNHAQTDELSTLRERVAWLEWKGNQLSRDVEELKRARDKAEDNYAAQVADSLAMSRRYADLLLQEKLSRDS
ncbi:hypothetical protein GGR58DRAFT_509320 [Xylaria digitata]|nr:hypothetical protein GGR58DRAFT_509320 [Xylaria digitata]